MPAAMAHDGLLADAQGLDRALVLEQVGDRNDVHALRVLLVDDLVDHAHPHRRRARRDEQRVARYRQQRQNNGPKHCCSRRDTSLAPHDLRRPSLDLADEFSAAAGARDSGVFSEVEPVAMSVIIGVAKNQKGVDRE